MKKRIAVVGISMALGVTLLLSTAFASAQSLSPYEAYKEAAKNTFANKNFTMNVKAQVSDNGQSLIALNSVMKAAKGDTESFSGSSSVTANGTTISVQNYGANGQLVTKIDGNDTYYVSKEDPANGNCGSHMRGENTAEEERVGNMILDSVVGDLKNNFVSKANADGSSTISVNLESSQIPAVVNGVVSLAIKDGANKHDEMHGDMSMDKVDFFKMVPAAKNMEVQLPKLVQDISIKSATMNAEVSSAKIITSKTMSVVVTGKDEAGKVHEITFNMNLNLTDLNNTTPDKVDLTGKTVKTIEHTDRVQR